MIKILEITVDYDTRCEIINIGNGTFAPLKGFMDSADYKSVVENMHLKNGEPWTIPVTLDIPDDLVNEIVHDDKVLLKDAEGNEIAELTVEDIFKVNYENDLKKIFGTDDKQHPGVLKEISRSPIRVGGKLNVFIQRDEMFGEHSLTPHEARIRFAENGWKTVVGFQTRNPIHRAHEYLQKVGLETVDGLFVHPLIGWKKADDFAPVAIVKAYEEMIKHFYPEKRAMLGLLKTPMRYAGPREAVFHALIRKNYGCTHFIVGRDHAGVGNYYGKYEAQELISQFNDLGIEILKLCGPYFCTQCNSIVTEKTCPHGDEFELSISGTQVRHLFKSGQTPPENYMRKEIADVLLSLQKDNQLFCGDENENI